MSSRVQRHALPWCDPALLVPALVERFGAEGLVWLDGDGTAQGRWSRIGVAPQSQIVCRGLPAMAGASDPFAALEAMGEQGGHWMGWLAYEAGAWVEPADHWLCSDLAMLWAARFESVLVLDHQYQTLVLEGSHRSGSGTASGSSRESQSMALAKTLEALIGELANEKRADRRINESQCQPTIALGDWSWLTTSERFGEQVEQIRGWIARGDVFQANLTACCEASTRQPPDPLALYLRLRSHCPAPFGGVAIAGSSARGEAVLSSSPERFLKLDVQGRVETRPIKGTRPRRSEPSADADEAAALITSAKDRAENVMIVDLLRNDLGRVCRPGSIGVPQLVGLESYRQVHHLTSVVEGTLSAERSLVDLLRACWPGGSISGAPKIRACQRLASLEPVPRGPYCGSLFWLGPDGQFDSNILIRSVVLKDQRLRVHAGCGIVADSDPMAEALEMGWKLKPLLEALA